MAFITVLFIFVTFQWTVNSSCISTAWHVISSHQICDGGDGDDEPSVSSPVHLNKAMPSILRSAGLGRV